MTPSERVVLWQQQNREAYNAKMRAWRAKNRDKTRAYERKRREKRKAENPHLHRDKLLRSYGLTRESWLELFRKQGERCAICGTDDSGGRWHTDHDATQSKKAVRGILCVRCNIGLGQFQHERSHLAAAIEYLRQYEERCQKT